MGNESTLPTVGLFLIIFGLLAPATESSTSCPEDCFGYNNNAGGKFNLACDCSDTRNYKIQTDKGDVVEINCNFRSPVNYSISMFEEFGVTSALTQFRFIQCPIPTNLPFSAILNGTSPTFIRFSSEIWKLNPTSRMFENLPDLKFLNLKRNKIDVLPIFDFNMTKLISLDLSENNIDVLPPNFFDSFQNLENLNLEVNGIKRIDSSAGKLDKLNVLLLNRNQLEYVDPLFIQSMTSLTALNLQENRLTDLPEDLVSACANLTILKVFSNRLESVSPNLLRNNLNLTELTLRDNPSLNTLPAILLSNLSKLEELNLKNCNLTSFPTGFFDGLTGLRTINFDRNNIDVLDPNLLRDSRLLEKFSAAFNDLVELNPDFLQNFRNLQVLDLSNNSIVSINQSHFGNVRNIKRINLSKNNISYIDEYTFNSLFNLETLDLSFNKISDDSRFWFPRKIRTVDLSNNNISEIHGSWTTSATKLEKLNLERNVFTEISYLDLQILSSADISLKFNKIRRIRFEGAEDIFLGDEGSNPPRVSFGNNPIICDCHLYYFNQYLKLQGTKLLHLRIADDPLCASPVELANRPISSLEDESFFCVDTSCIRNETCTCSFYAYNESNIVDCAGAGLTRWPDNLPLSTSVFRAQNNNLKSLPDFSDRSWTSLTNLDLSYNLVNLPQRKNNASLPRSLTFLSLVSNNLTTLPDWLMEDVTNSTNLTIAISRNPWLCDCTTENFKDWVRTNADRIRDVYALKCGDFKLLDAEFCVLPDQSDLILGVSVFFALFSTILALMVFLYYRYKQEIKVWLFTRGFCLCILAQEDLDKDKVYDAFISYSHEDCSFVEQELMPKLEPKFKLCVHQRDWLGGEWIPEQIVRSVENSRKIVILLSKSFINSVWGRLEFKTAHRQALKDRSNRIIIIVYGELPPMDDMDPELKVYIKFNTYIKWDDPWFWDKLKYALPHKKEVKDKVAKNNKVGTDNIEISVINNNRRNMAENTNSRTVVPG